VRIDAQRLSKTAEAKKATAEDLARVIERDGLRGKKAVSAVKNWMRGSDHPRCKADDIRKMADALGVDAGKIAKFTCIFRFHRGSPRKAKLLVDLIRGKDMDTATNLLSFNIKKAAVDVKKALLSAVADAEQANVDLTNLIVIEASADKGPVMKRIQPKDRGRAHAILKRMSHLRVSLAEKI
jgi:large subunit ribosomal protein L22